MLDIIRNLEKDIETINDKIMRHIDLIDKIHLLYNSLGIYPEESFSLYSTEILKEYLDDTFNNYKDEIINKFIKPLIPDINENEVYIIDYSLWTGYTIYIINKNDLDKAIDIVDMYDNMEIVNNKNKVAEIIFNDMVNKEITRLRNLKEMIKVKRGIENLLEMNVFEF